MELSNVDVKFEALFSDLSLEMHPVQHEWNFHPSFTGFTSVINKVYSHFDHRLKKEVPVEALRYYGSCLFWLRVIQLKCLFGDELTMAEEDIWFTFRCRELTVPEPIYLGLMAIGQYTAFNGVNLRPMFPALPTECTDGIPGSFGVVDEDNHHWYEDYPVIGPAYEALIHRASTTDSESYKSVFAPPELSVNANLQGYGRLRSARNDHISFLNGIGVEENGFSTIKRSGFSSCVIGSLSNLLKNSDPFRNFNVCFSKLSRNGTEAQQIEAHPVFEDGEIPIAADSCVIMKSASKNSESNTMAGVSMVYGLNLWKENSNSSELWEKVCPWSSVTFSQSHPPSEKWIVERNKYRNMPLWLQSRSFAMNSNQMDSFRINVVSKLAHENTRR